MSEPVSVLERVKVAVILFRKVSISPCEGGREVVEDVRLYNLA